MLVPGITSALILTDIYKKELGSGCGGGCGGCGSDCGGGCGGCGGCGG